MKNSLKSLILAMVVGLASAGPHKINIEGDSILSEGAEATYVITIKNTHTEEYVDLVVAVEGLQESGLRFCSAHSNDLEIVSSSVDGEACVESFTPSLAIGQVVTLLITVKASLLKKVGELRSLEMAVRVTGENFRRGVARKTTTIYKAS